MPGRINHTISSIDKVPYCEFGTAKSDVVSILNNIVITKVDYLIKTLPMKGEYINCLKKCVESFNGINQYEQEYSKRLSKITNRGSMLFAIVCFTLSTAIQVFSFISTWNSVGPEFHTNMIVIAVTLTIFIPLLVFTSIKSRFNNTIMELEAIYCLYSYQYLEMPYGDDFPSKVVDLNDNHLVEKYENKDIIGIFLNRYNKECITHTFYYRDIRLNSVGKMTIYGFIDSSYFEECLKKTLLFLNR